LVNIKINRISNSLHIQRHLLSRSETWCE